MERLAGYIPQSRIFLLTRRAATTPTVGSVASLLLLQSQIPLSQIHLF